MNKKIEKIKKGYYGRIKKYDREYMVHETDNLRNDLASCLGEIERLEKENLWLRGIIQQTKRCVEAIRATYLVKDDADELLRRIQNILNKVKEKS